MKKAVGIIYLFLVQILFVPVSLAQQLPTDSLAQRFQQLNLTNPEDVLYVATDKDIYLPGETIWFAGYLLEGVQKEEALQADLLGVALLREDSTAVSLRKNYLLEQGLCPGSLTLPENLTPGRYLLLATTNLSKGNGEPLHRFYRPLTVMSTTAPEISVDFEIDEDNPIKDSLYIEVYAMLPDDLSNGGLRRSRVTYNLPGQKETDVDLDKNGRARITLAKSAVRDSTPVLFTTTKIDREEKTFNVRLPITEKRDILDRTSTASDTLLKLGQTVASDTLKIAFERDSKESLQLAVTHLHTRKTEVTPAFKPKQGMKMELPLEGIDKGINQLDLFNLKGEPITSNLFFAHYDKKNTVDLQLNKESFTVRDSVGVDLDLRDAEGNELGGIFTVACVQVDRLEKEQQMDLESYYYMHPLIEDVGHNAFTSLITFNKRSTLDGKLRSPENLLYTQKSSHTIDTLRRILKDSIRGQIRQRNGFTIRGSAYVLVRQMGGVARITLDDLGNFAPEPKTVTTPENGYIHFQVIKGNKNITGIQLSGFRLSVEDPFEELLPKLLANGYPATVNISNVQNQKSFILPASDPANRQYTLETVFLKEKKDWRVQSSVANECGDFVCVNGYFNCPNIYHGPTERGSRAPVKGTTYMLRDSPKYITYPGCIISDRRMQVHTSREFIGMDKEKLDNKYADFYLSTLFWEGFRAATLDDRIQFGFYTSDQTGTYKLKLEGIATNGDFIKAEKTFRVSK